MNSHTPSYRGYRFPREISAFNGTGLRHLDIAAAHEDFVDELKASGIGYAVLRATALRSYGLVEHTSWMELR